MPNDKKPDTKRTVHLAADLAIAGMGTGIFASHKAEDVAAYCLTVAKEIMQCEVGPDPEPD